MVALSPCATTSTWFGWWALALSAIALQRVCQKRSGCDRQKIQKTPQDTVETVKKPNNNKVKMKNLGVKKGHLSQGHSPLLLVVLLLSCFGCCNADAFPQSPKTPFSGNVSGLFWGDGNLAANRYHLCPTGTLPAVPSLMVLTSHGHAGQQLLHAADDRSFITIKSLASLLRLRAGFPAPRCKRAASLATLAIRQCGIHVGFPWRFVPNTIFCFMWFFHWISRSKSRRKRQKHKKRCGIHHGKRKPTSFGTKFGPCRWIKGRRFRVKKRNTDCWVSKNGGPCFSSCAESVSLEDVLALGPGKCNLVRSAKSSLGFVAGWAFELVRPDIQDPGVATKPNEKQMMLTWLTLTKIVTWLKLFCRSFKTFSRTNELCDPGVTPRKKAKEVRPQKRAGPGLLTYFCKPCSLPSHKDGRMKR